MSASDTARYALLGDYVVAHVDGGTYDIGNVDVNRTYRHWLDRKDLGRDVSISVAPWDIARQATNRDPGSWSDNMILSVVCQKAVQWEDVEKMDEMSRLTDQVIDRLSLIAPATLGTSPDHLEVQLNPQPSTEPFLLPEDVTDKGVFTSRVAIQFFVQRGD